jgi:hypothetical protein
MDVGQVFEDGRVVIDPRALARARQLPLHKPRCESCFAQWTCAGGCHVNQTYPGCTDQYTSFCIQTRLVTACVLLRDLGCDDLVDELLADRRAMETLAHHGWDPIDVGLDLTGNRSAEPDVPLVHGRGSERARSLVAEGLTLLA